MSRYNLFSGNKTITETVAKALGFQIEVDDYKRVTIWEFDVKDFRITVNLNSSNVIFMIFGKYQESAMVKNSPYSVKRWRETRKKIDEYLPLRKEEGIKNIRAVSAQYANSYLDKRCPFKH